ncbi:sigma-70 family RNA polymerase sigma factor [Streptomyces sp. NPDC059037]|uniref:sigma-70 family RNA polymerase sigma factor n=1 Tax=Streptomyces sp. NPDC059037 TaxID=3346710 RepID=UPI003692E4DB
MSGTSEADDATRAFVDHRELLFSLVYNMLGTVADTEDVLQETWLAWAPRHAARDAEPIGSPRAYLVRIAVNKALARQSVISRRRETYIGPWLPEPLLTRAVEPVHEPDAAEAVERAESVSMALLVVLETLSPLERAVFVLHEVFGYAHTETAEIIGRTPAAVRQLAHRAREHVRARRPAGNADARRRREVTERFAEAVAAGDAETLLRLLAPDVVLWADGGGKAPGAGPRPLRGPGRVAELLVKRAALRPAGAELRYCHINGDPSVLLFNEGAPYAVLVLDLTPDGERVRGLYNVMNPDKLAHLA